MARGLRVVTGAGVVTLLILGGQAGARQEPSQDQQPPTFRTGINFVRVDVVASQKDGRQISDLKAEDFEITEGGKRQRIETFKLITLDGGRAPGLEGASASISSSAVEEHEAARDDVRMFAIFLDDYHVSPAMGRTVREQLARLVETQFGPSDLVGLMYPLTSLASVQMSRNRDAVSKIIRAFEGRRGVNTPKNAYEENYVYRTGNVAGIRRDVSFSAIKGLIMRMGGLKEGRKTLILVSEGYGGGGTGFQNLREIADLASRNNVAIYPVSPRILPPASQWMPTSPMEAMNYLAEHSGGRAIFDQAQTGADFRTRRAVIELPLSNLATAMKQIVVDSNAYYLLGYNSTRTTPDGKFHKIDVKVKRAGVELRYRKGYFASKPEDDARSTPVRPPAPFSVVETALAETAAPRGRPVRTWIGMARGENGLTRVTVAWEPLPDVPGDVVKESDRPVSLTLSATGSNGVTYFDGRVPDGPSERSSGFHTAFDAPAGTIQLRLAVASATGTILDTEVRNLAVSDLTAPRVALGTPEVYRARTVPELQRLRSAASPTPVAAREFSRTERLLIRVPAYAPGSETPRLEAQLLNRAGQPMTEFPITSSEIQGVAREVEIPLAGLPSGEYGVRITATVEGVEASEIVAFRVTN